MKCAWFSIADEFSSCDEEATLVGCDGPCCAKHKCRCARPIADVERDRFIREARRLSGPHDEGEGTP